MLPSVSFAGQSALSISQLQRTIAAKNAGWVAHDSWVTRLPKAQLKRMLGLKDRPSTDLHFKAPETSSVYSAFARSSSLDWRNKDGVNWVSPILNQGNCGSCVAFAAVGTLETQVNVSSGIPGLNPKFSTQALFNCGGASCDWGWEPSDAAHYLKSEGTPDEACMPYTSGATGEDVSCSNICSDAASRSYKIVSYKQPTRGYQDIAAVKAALSHGPLVTTLTVYTDFLYYSGGIYKHVSGEAEGGHAVSIVGYNDAGRYWIVRNSWGPDWGENGYIRVSYDDESGVSDETWSYEVPQADGYVTLRHPSELEFISGKVSFDIESTYKTAQSLNVYVDGHNVSTLNPQTACVSEHCSYLVDSTSLSDGRHDAYVAVNTGSKTVKSQHSVFYVLNRKPTAMTLKLTSSEADLSQPLSGRVVLNVAAKTGVNVPFSWMQFHARQNGKEVYSKLANIVVDKMTLGWRTPGVADGNYEIYFTAGIDTLSGQHYQVESSHINVQVNNGNSTNDGPVVGLK
jgi:C1A family cysteine protease